MDALFNNWINGEIVTFKNKTALHFICLDNQEKLENSQPIELMEFKNQPVLIGMLSLCPTEDSPD